MSFLHPEVIYFLLPLVVILFGFLLTQKEVQAHFFSDEVLKKLSTTNNSLSAKTRNILFFFVFVFIVLALAKPVIKDGKIEVKAKSADIMIALDISDSMLAEDIYPNRLKDAKDKAIELLKIAPNERIGVIAFAKNSYLVSPLSFDHNAVGFLLRQLNTSSITEKGTDLMSMLQVVDRSIKNESQKYLLLMSDGGDDNDFSKEINFAKEHKIAVFVLGMGTEKGAPIKQKDGTFIKQHGEIIVSKLNSNIAKLATKTGGVYIENVRSDEDIKTMLQEIEKHSVKKELKSEEVEKFIALFYYPLGMAIFLLLIATSSRYKRGLASLLLLGTLFSLPQSLHASLLDFMQLDNAKEAYKDGDYVKASHIYDSYAKESDNQSSYYNNANALYKQKKYADAIKSYEKAHFKDKIKEANRHANIGNALVKQAKPELLKKALKSYEKSLALHEDKAVREDYEAVKKFLEKQKQKKKQQKKDNKKNKDKKNQKKKDDKKNKDKKKSDKDSKDKKDSKDGKDSDKKSDKQKESHKQQKNQEKKESQKSKSEKQKKKDEKKKKDSLKELKDKDKSKKEEKQMSAGEASKKKMSNEEEQKWLNKLNQQKNTYMYMLNNQNNKKEDTNEKPW